MATKVCLDYLNPVELLGMRMLIAMPIFLIIILKKRIDLKFKGVRWRIIAASAIVTLHFLIQITGIKYTSATNTGWIVGITPLVIALLAFLILKERLGRYAIVGIISATLGILSLVSRGKVGELGWLSSYGDWLVLGSAHTWALYTIITRDISRSRNPLAVTFAVFLPSLVITFAIMAFTSDISTFTHLPLRAAMALLFLGLFGTALGHWAWQFGVSRIGAAEASIFLYLEPVATTALAVPYLHEAFGPFKALGGALVIFGVWIAQRKTRP